MADTEQAKPDYSGNVFEDGENVVVNMDSVEEAKFEVVPKGVYDGEFESVEFGRSKEKNSPMLTCWITITGPSNMGRKLPYYLVFSPAALPFTKAAINRIEDGPKILGGAQVNLQQIADSGALLGKRCRFRVGIKEYEGQDRSNITQFLPLAAAANGGGQPAPGKFA